jgi:hypothetical protein
MKTVYAIQPYHVGSKNAKSLALVIPAKIAKKYQIYTSTIFALKGNDTTRSITLQTVNGLGSVAAETSLSLRDSKKSIETG